MKLRLCYSDEQTVGLVSRQDSAMQDVYTVFRF